MTPILHHYWRSSASYRVRIAIALKGLSVEYRQVDLAGGAQRDEAFLAINPQGLVPVLQHGTLVVTQSFAIIDYLEALRPEPPLLPSDPARRAGALAIAYAVAMDVHPICNLRVLNRVEHLAGAEARRTWNMSVLAEGLAAVEAMLPEAGFASGEGPGLAELTLVPQAYNAERWGLDLARWPRLQRLTERCRAHPAFAAAHPDQFRP